METSAPDVPEVPSDPQQLLGNPPPQCSGGVVATSSANNSVPLTNKNTSVPNHLHGQLTGSNNIPVTTTHAQSSSGLPLGSATSMAHVSNHCPPSFHAQTVAPGQQMAANSNGTHQNLLGSNGLTANQQAAHGSQRQQTTNSQQVDDGIDDVSDQRSTIVDGILSGHIGFVIPP